MEEGVGMGGEGEEEEEEEFIQNRTRRREARFLTVRRRMGSGRRRASEE